MEEINPEFDVEAIVHRISDEFMTLFGMIDLCPFLASERAQYDDAAVLAHLTRCPGSARLPQSYRCGIGLVRPLAVVVALGGSLEVVKLMVRESPEALEEKLSGKRNVLHYAIAEGAGVDVIRYLISQHPPLVKEMDTFDAIPLHLAASYPSSSASVLTHLLHVHPKGARALDYRYLTPLHRACKSRASLEKVLALLEIYPDALWLKDGGRNTPLGWAEKVDHSLTDAVPEVAQILEMTEDVLRLGREEGVGEEARNNLGEHAIRVLDHFRSIRWMGGIRLAFARNCNLASLVDAPMPELLALLGSAEDAIDCCGVNVNEDSKETEQSARRLRLKSIFSVLVQCPDLVGGAVPEAAASGEYEVGVI
ncbi:hypothetical protein ACHAXT_011085 [Thalassiosira profunda]